MYKLAPLLAYAYAMRFAAGNLHKFYSHALNEEIKKNKDFKSLELLHHLSAGYKAFFTTIAKDGLETVRQSCGGAGFSEFSGLPILCSEYAPHVTFEGDNILMAQ